jgi:predicted choloylglycine hydrolase
MRRTDMDDCELCTKISASCDEMNRLLLETCKLHTEAIRLRDLVAISNSWTAVLMSMTNKAKADILFANHKAVHAKN